LTSKQDGTSFKIHSSESKNEGTQVLNTDGSTLPWFRGLLLCRRCDFCGTRIGIHGEGDDRVIMKCPECSREYVFFERSE
jgi:hypothetical protein